MQDTLDLLGISRISNSEIFTPIKVVKEMVDLLPQEVFAPNTKFLDPACKTGRYLIEIKNRLMESQQLIDVFPVMK